MSRSAAARGKGNPPAACSLNVERWTLDVGRLSSSFAPRSTLHALRSFTLIETLLAITIIIMILGTVFSFYSQAMRLTVRGRERLADIQLARVVLHKIAGELRGVTAAGKRFNTLLSGEPDKISFITTVIPSRLVFLPADFTDRGRVIEHDLRHVTYYLSHPTDNGASDNGSTVVGLGRDELRCMLTPLIERESDQDLSPEELEKQQKEREQFKVDFDLGGNEALSEQPILQQTLISEKIKFLRFDYYNGKKWLSRWHPTERDALPRAVQVTIGYTEVPEEEARQEQLLAMDQRPWHEDRYSIVVSLILADDLKTQSSAASDDASEGEQEGTR